MSSLKRFFFQFFAVPLLVLSLLLPLLISLNLSNQAGAVSALDNNYVLTNSMEITDDTNTCSAYDLENTWYSYLQSATTATTHFWTGPQLTNAKNKVKDAIDNNRTWGVSSQQTGTGDIVLNVYASTGNGTPQVSFSGTQVVLNQGTSPGFVFFQYMIKFAHDGSGGCNPELINYSLPSSVVVSNDQTENTKVKNAFLSGSYAIAYPSLYEGTEIRNNFNIGDPTRPSLEISVSGNDVNLSILRTNFPDPHTTCDPFLDWYVTNNNVVKGTRLDTQTSYVWNLTLPNGTYLFGVEPSDPFITESFEIDGIITGDIGCDSLFDDPDALNALNYGSQVMEFTIDGSSFIQNTDSLDCDNNTGVCVGASPYEDCSAYGLLDIQGFTCVMKNFISSIRAFFTNLFIPKGSFLLAKFKDFNTFLVGKLGIVYFPVTFINEVVGGFISGASTQTCTIEPNGTFWGEPVSFSICIEDSPMPLFQEYAFTAIRAITVFGSMMFLLSKLRSIIGAKEQEA